MAIYSLPGRKDQIVTTELPSGDVRVTRPWRGPLEQIAFMACKEHGDPSGRDGRDWIVRADKARAFHASLALQCVVVAP